MVSIFDGYHVTWVGINGSASIACNRKRLVVCVWRVLHGPGVVAGWTYLCPKNAEHSELVRGAIRRMRSAPPLLSRDEYKNLTSYDGPVVNGDPEGRLPDNLEEDDDDGVAE